MVRGDCLARAPTDRPDQREAQGLWRPRPGKWGALRLTTRDRRSGEPRKVIVRYYEDALNLVSMAMNGWGAGRACLVAEPAGR